MRAELVLMGRRVDMAQRARRRALVVGIYAVFAALITGLWFVDQWRSTGTYIYWAAMCRLLAVSRWLLRGGLVKPFTGKGPRQSDSAPSLLSLKLRMYPAQADDDRAYRNDERELNQRDRAHYLAYQAMAVLVVAAWIVAYTGMVALDGVNSNDTLPDVLRHNAGDADVNFHSAAVRLYETSRIWRQRDD